MLNRIKQKYFKGETGHFITIFCVIFTIRQSHVTRVQAFPSGRGQYGSSNRQGKARLWILSAPKGALGELHIQTEPCNQRASMQMEKKLYKHFVRVPLMIFSQFGHVIVYFYVIINQFEPGGMGMRATRS